MVKQLNANIFNDEAYSKIINELSNVDILYLDNFFKFLPQLEDYKNRQKILEIAYTILNNAELTGQSLIISFEFKLDFISTIDEAISGRIIKMLSKEYIVHIKNDSSRNYRLKNIEEI